MSVRSWDGYWDTTTPRLGGIDMTEIKVDALVNAIKRRSPWTSCRSMRRRRSPGVKERLDVVVQAPIASIQLRIFLMNPTEKPFDDVRVRQAMAYAIDRKAIADVMTEGLSPAQHQWYPKGFVGYDPALDTLYQYDRRQGQSTPHRSRLTQRLRR